jgi:hypothetical protein
VSSTYTGWTRLPGQSWQAIVTAAVENEVWRQLREHVEQLGPRFVDTYVGPSAVDPNDKPASMRRRRF